MRLRRKLALILGAVSLAMVATIGTSELAHADVGHNWCLGSTSPGECINAWGGGPWVKLYTGGPTDNGLFAATSGSGNSYLLFGHFASPWSSHCIGHANNDPSDARVSLDACPGATGGSSSGDGWGTHVTFRTDVCSNGWTAIQDNHTGGWVGPASEGNGAQFYLNKPSPWCYRAA